MPKTKIDKIIKYIEKNKEIVYSENGLDSDEFVYCKDLLNFIKDLKKNVDVVDLKMEKIIERIKNEG